jgi:hypothetical protein
MAADYDINGTWAQRGVDGVQRWVFVSTVKPSGGDFATLQSWHDTVKSIQAGQKLFRRVMHRRSDVRIFEKSIFCPLLPHESRLVDARKADYPGSYAVHWFNLSWNAAPDPAPFAPDETVSYSSSVTGRYGD